MNVYEIVRVSPYGDEEEDVHLLENNLKYPEICRYVEDAEETFIVDLRTGKFERFTVEFFYMNQITKFKVIHD